MGVAVLHAWEPSTSATPVDERFGRVRAIWNAFLTLWWSFYCLQALEISSVFPLVHMRISPAVSMSRLTSPAKP